MAKVKSNLKQLYLYKDTHGTLSISYEKEKITYSGHTSPYTKNVLQGIPINNPVGEYILEFSHICYRGIVVKVIDAPDSNLRNAVIIMSTGMFNKCIAENFFSKENDKLIIQGKFQIFKGFLELR